MFMSFPRWMNWLFLAFLGYIVVVGNFSSRDQPPTQFTAATQTYPHLNELTKARNWARAVNPDAVAGCGAAEMEGLSLFVLREGDGKGPPLDCVTVARLNMQRLSKAGMFEAPQRAAKNLKDATLPTAIRHGAHGMKQGEVRMIVAPEITPQKNPATPDNPASGVWLVRLD